MSRHLFDVAFYGRQVGIDFGRNMSGAVDHFLNEGDRQDVDPHPMFSTSWYRRHAEIDRNTNALLHFIAHAKADPHPLFSNEWYRTKNEGALHWRDDPLAHYVTRGYRERRLVHPLFDDRWYRATYPDIDQDDTNVFAHFLSQGAFEGRSPCELFDTTWYVNKYKVFGNALIHYLQEGAALGFDPSPQFSSAWYWNTNPSVAASEINPLVDFLESGRAAGKRPVPHLKLDEKFSIDNKTFDEWRRILRLKSPVFPADGGLGSSETDGRKSIAGRTAKRRLRIVVRVAQPRVERGSEPLSESVRGACERLGIDLSWIGDIESGRKLVDLSDGTFVLFLKDGDVLDRAGLEALYATLLPSTRLCLFDMFFKKGGRAFPLLLPGFNPLHVKAVDCTFSRFALRGDDVVHLLQKRVDPSDRVLLLAALDRVLADGDHDGLVHVPFPVVQIADVSEEIGAMRQAALAPPAFDISALGDAKVSVVITTRDKGLFLRQLLANLLSQMDEVVKDVTIVSDQMQDFYAERTLDEWWHHPKIQVLHYEKPFNFSDQSNLGAAEGTGDFILFLDEDLVPVSADWLRDLMAPFVDADVGITGPLLLHPNESVQHAGIYLGDGVAYHPLRDASFPDDDYFFLGTSAREVSVVTGTALMIRRSVFADLNGFDIQLASIYQDVDLCLRISNLGLRTFYVPKAILHTKSVIMRPVIDEAGHSSRDREAEYFRRRHGREILARDRFHNPCFSRNDPTLHTLQS